MAGVAEATFIALAGVAAAAFGHRKLRATSRVALRLKELASKGGERRGAAATGALSARLDALIQPLALARVLDGRLEQAKVALSAGEFAGLCLLLGSLLAVLGVGLGLPPIASGLLALIGLYLPTWHLEGRREARIRAFNRQLPDALLQMVNALRAGNGLWQTIQQLGQQMPDPMGDELRRVMKELNWGIPLETALGNLRDRIGTSDVELLTTALVVHRETGGKLSELINTLHETLRERIRVQGEVHALTAQGRLSGTILGGMPIALGAAFALISPGYVRVLFADPRGRALLGAAIALEIIGWLAIRRMVRVRF